jgi:hypothetical protein
MTDSISKLKDELWDIEDKASRLPWANLRCWKFDTHLWVEQSMLVIDLHELNVKLAKQVIKKTSQIATSMEYACICFVTGQGNKSQGKAKIRPMAIEVVGEVALKKGWKLTSGTQGRLTIILDEERAPAVVTSKLSKTVVFGMYAFFALIFFLFIRGLFTV